MIFGDPYKILGKSSNTTHIVFTYVLLILIVICFQLAQWIVRLPVMKVRLGTVRRAEYSGRWTSRLLE